MQVFLRVTRGTRARGLQQMRDRNAMGLRARNDPHVWRTASGDTPARSDTVASPPHQGAPLPHDPQGFPPFPLSSTLG